MNSVMVRVNTPSGPQTAMKPDRSSNPVPISSKLKKSFDFTSNFFFFFKRTPEEFLHNKVDNRHLLQQLLLSGRTFTFNGIKEQTD